MGGRLAWGMRPAEIKALTSLRGIAALWVFAFHMRYEVAKLFPGDHRWIDPVLASGFLGVDLFFVLSGMVIGLVYFPRLERFDWSEYAMFVRRRFARIYPAYLVALTLVVLVFLGFHQFDYDYHRPSRFDPGALVESLLMVQSWTYPVKSRWNVPDWSVSAEWLAYLCFPLLVQVTRRFRSSGGIAVAILALLAVNGLALHHIGRGSAMALALPRVATGFGLGVLLYRLRERTEPTSRLWPWAAIIAALCVPALYATSKAHHIDPLIWAPAVFGIVVIGLAVPSAQHRFFTGRAPVYLGTISYSIYLIHDIVLLAARATYNSREMTGSAVPLKFAYLAVITAVVIAAAHVLHRYVESPWRARLGGR